MLALTPEEVKKLSPAVRKLVSKLDNCIKNTPMVDSYHKPNNRGFALVKEDEIRYFGSVALMAKFLKADGTAVHRGKAGLINPAKSWGYTIFNVGLDWELTN